MLCCGSGHYASFFPSWMMIKWWCLLSGTKSFFVSMNNNNRNWNILNWNIRGMNSEDKCLALRQKIDESDCNIVCLQETKRETFDTAYLKKFCPSRINNFAFLPSVGASGGFLWPGMAHNSLGRSLHKTGSHFPCSSPVCFPISLGFFQISMAHVILKTKWSLFTGF